MLNLNLAGQQLGNYRLVTQIGHGGYSEVYLGQHVYLETQVAIKVLHARLTDNEEVERFRDEARTIAKLLHPHIIRVLDFGIQDDIPYLVMDYAPHGTLRERYPKGEQLSLETIMLYVRQVAEALHFAHEQKLVHRDIKPENMLLGDDDNVYLSDFGTALVVQTTGFQSPLQEEIIGTIAYMAPELFQGKARPASDQYSLGIVIYEWLTGHTPFHGTATEIAIQHATVPPPPLRDSLPSLSIAVEQVIMRALAKDYHQRYSDVQDFADMLEKAVAQGDAAFSDGEATAALAPTPVVPDPREEEEETHIILTPPNPTQAAYPASSTVYQPSYAPLQRRRRLPALALLLLALCFLLVAGVLWLSLAYLPGVLAPQSQPSAAYMNISGTYSGSIHNTTSNIMTSMGLTIQQNQETIGGQFTVGPALTGSGPFTGTLTTAGLIQFTVQGYHGNAPLFFSGSTRSDGSLAGTYCSLNQSRHCSAQAGGGGVWNVSHTRATSATPTSTRSTVPTSAPADPSHKGHKHGHH